ncbi:hypothetical protein SAMD00019534_107910 [Acytostelium subglobosum LB1]|uniref:hypothetical protein n=1 Tax=Acytostelium subglobosum LB1 TaxID=1410327 RepID=UPI000644A0ED|nr:hypothetical protein SAMD00019534_107910 [Acytostelium subglobosum LB1]GAM27615.1 hypothetical protein SAMD00019534_107910 [Acytostelium subglobosum LB1]|eukprot:XP_012749274.1 hypothetical protein SAMD00019534_107910 [Acytostelium subglobosum LB1]
MKSFFYLEEPKAFFQSLAQNQVLQRLELFLFNQTGFNDYKEYFFDYLQGNSSLNTLALGFIRNPTYLNIIASKHNIKRLQISMNEHMDFPAVRSLVLSSREDSNVYSQLVAIKENHGKIRCGLESLTLKFYQSFHTSYIKIIENLPSLCIIIDTLRYLRIELPPYHSHIDNYDKLFWNFGQFSRGTLECLHLVATEEYFNFDFLIASVQYVPTSSNDGPGAGSLKMIIIDIYDGNLLRRTPPDFGSYSLVDSSIHYCKTDTSTYFTRLKLLTNLQQETPLSMPLLDENDEIFWDGNEIFLNELESDNHQFQAGERYVYEHEDEFEELESYGCVFSD